MTRFGIIMTTLVLSWQAVAQTPYQILQKTFENQDYEQISEIYSASEFEK